MNKQTSNWDEILPEIGKSVAHNSPDIEEELINTTKAKADKVHHVAEQIYKIRRKRDKFFGNNIFSDPAWDIILDLYISERSGKKISITSACIAAGVPASTGLRWITILIQNGYVERHDDPADARRALVSLTPMARSALETLFAQFDLDRLG